MLVIAPYFMNHLKVIGSCIIFEEKWISTNRVVNWYLNIWEIIKFHQFELFFGPFALYVPSWVWEFYKAYVEQLLKPKKGVLPKPLYFFEVRENEVQCGPSIVNKVLGCTFIGRDIFQDKLAKHLDEFIGWLAPL